VLIAADESLPAGCDLLLNLAQGCPPHFERFERLLEIVSRDDAERQAGRGRYRFYKERGYPIVDHDLAKSGGRGG
jgi:DNA polymerase-3 subunit chi